MVHGLSAAAALSVPRQVPSRAHTLLGRREEVPTGWRSDGGCVVRCVGGVGLGASQAAVR